MIAKRNLDGAARGRVELNSNAERILIPKRLLEVALREQTSIESTNDEVWAAKTCEKVRNPTRREGKKREAGAGVAL